jgi:cyclopropane-fatty-acyl-phospholipid synthase
MSQLILPQPRAERVDRTPPFTALARRQLLSRLERLSDGRLLVKVAANRAGEPAETLSFGRDAEDLPTVELEVLSERFWGAVAFGGSVGAGESYIHGDWTVNDLTALIRLMTRNASVLEDLEGGLARLTGPARRVLHWFNRNDLSGSRRNIAAHYDLGNAFFERMLDPTMAYSSAIYPSPASTLHEAQLFKFDTICRKLALQPGDELLEIGTGWGGLAIHAAQQYGARVTTTTISKEQHDFAREAVALAGLTGRVTLLFDDYRDLKGTFNKLVSIEMIEAVGHQFLDTYLGTCSQRLSPDGMMLLQAITLQDQSYDAALKQVDFIQRFVFPGSFIPSVSAITASLTRATDLKVFDLEDIGPHYARTLADWRRNVFADTQGIRELGYSEEFLRLWEFYLCYCEGGFAERHIGDVQLLLTKPRCRRSPLRGA